LIRACQALQNSADIGFGKQIFAAGQPPMRAAAGEVWNGIKMRDKPCFADAPLKALQHLR
jgi:hypothetical protein